MTLGGSKLARNYQMLMGSVTFVRCKKVSNLSFEVMHCPTLSDLTIEEVRIVMLMHSI